MRLRKSRMLERKVSVPSTKSRCPEYGAVTPGNPAWGEN